MDPILPSPSDKTPQDLTIREMERILAPEDASKLPAAPNADAPAAPKKNAPLDSLISFARDMVVIVLVVLVIRATLVSPFQINGISMDDSYRDGELIVLDHLSYFWSKNFGRELQRGDIGPLQTLTSRVLDWTVGWFDFKVGDPRRGDVVVFRPHAENGKDYYIKRVIGLPGDTIKIQQGRVFLKPAGAAEFVKLDEAYLSEANYANTQVPVGQNTFVVPAEKYFVMGDNRQWSTDSRMCFRSPSEGCAQDSFHYVDRSDILGKVLLSLGDVTCQRGGVADTVMRSISGGKAGCSGQRDALFRDARWLSTTRGWNYPELSGTGAASK